MTNQAYSTIIKGLELELENKDKELQRLRVSLEDWKDRYCSLCDRISLEEGWDPSVEED